MSSRNGGRSLAVSLLIGALLVPLSALAATALIQADGEVVATEPTIVEDPVAEPPTTTTTTVAPPTTEPPAVEIATAQDVELACGMEGLALVEREATGTITPLEQAALDALRTVCETEGRPLPGKPAPPPVIRTVRRTTAPTASVGTGSRRDDDRYERREHEDDDDRYERREHEDDDDRYERREHEDDD